MNYVQQPMFHFAMGQIDHFKIICILLDPVKKNLRKRLQKKYKYKLSMNAIP